MYHRRCWPVLHLWCILIYEVDKDCHTHMEEGLENLSQTLKIFVLELLTGPEGNFDTLLKSLCCVPSLKPFTYTVCIDK